MKNWKTTVAGIIIGIGSIAAQWLQGMPMTGKDWIVAVGAIILGVVAKDSKVTGGTIPQDGGTIPDQK